MNWLWNDPVGFLVLLLLASAWLWFLTWLALKVPALIRAYRWRRDFLRLRSELQDRLYGNLEPEVTKLAPQIAKLTSDWKDVK